MATREVAAIECTCDRCGHVWNVAKMPARCARCKTPAWNRSELAEKPKVSQVMTPEKRPLKPSENRARMPVERPIETLPASTPPQIPATLQVGSKRDRDTRYDVGHSPKCQCIACRSSR